MIKFVYVFYLPLTKKTEGDLYIRDMTSRKMEIEYWDVTGIYFPDLEICDVLDRPYIRKFQSLKQLEKALAPVDRDTTVFLLQIPFNRKVIGLYRLFTRKKMVTSILAKGSLPLPEPKIGSPKQFLSFFYRRLKGFFWDTLKLTGWIKTHDIIFNAGKHGYETIGDGAKVDMKKGKVVQINYVDYDNYLGMQGESSVSPVKKTYAVFLDDNLPFHPDFKILKIPTLEPENYYRSLNAFFDRVERSTGLEVVVAAHPKAEYEENPFNGRMIFKYKTGELVRHCGLALAHFTTAVDFAVMFGKPLLFIYTDEFAKIYKRTYLKIVRQFSAVLGSPILNIDSGERTETICIPAVDAAKYTEFKYDYLTSAESEKKQTGEIIYNYLVSGKWKSPGITPGQQPKN